MKKLYILTILLIGTCCMYAQTDSVSKEIPLSLNQYLSNVSKGNLGYIAEQFNVTIAEAGLKASKIFPDPEISVSYSNNQDQTLHMGQGIETGISYPISLGNKRGANIAFARSQYELSQLALDEYFCNLRADAALGYFATLKAQKAYQLQEDTYKQLQKLAQSDSLRLSVGEANEIDAMQSSLEAKAQLNEVYQSKAEMQNAFADFARLQGKTLSDTLFVPSDDFPLSPREFMLPQLIENALKNKGDVKIAIKNKEISEKNLQLLKANRAFEFSLEAGYSYNSVVKNDVAPAPSFRSYSAGISIPLKFSNINRDAVHAAKFAIEQSETNCKDIELQITTEVTRAYNTFMSEKRKIEHYNHGVIDNAEKILKGRIYSYQRGESGLVDVINAQHTYNDLRNDFLETIYSYTSSIIELERVAAIWDLNIL
jgi:outer membrane protein, heavy metal efflux system